jgi:hypothetical protein
VTREENVALKLRVAELEGEIEEERSAKVIKLETTMKGYQENY